MIETSFLGKKISSSAESIILPNKTGGFFYYSDKPLSKYQGLFFNNSEILYKTIEAIKVDEGEVKNIIYNGSDFEVRYEKSFQSFAVEASKDAVIYETDSEKGSRFIFDCRKAYDIHKWGRYYDIYVEDGAIIIQYRKRHDLKENSKDEYDIFTAIVADPLSYTFKGEWHEQEYLFDAKRKDTPVRSLYDAIEMNVKRAVVVCSLIKKDAIKTAKEMFSAKKIKSTVEVSKKKISDLNVNYAYELSRNALNSLTVKFPGFRGIYAGLPWFYQFWTRDSAMSCRALGSCGEKDFEKNLLYLYLDHLRPDGLIPNMISGVGLDSIDGTGLVFLRIGEILSSYSEKEQKKIMDSLDDALSGIKAYHSENGFIISEGYETWMDTDIRDGARIEIQALYLQCYTLLKKLAKKFKSELISDLAEKTETELKGKIRSHFYRDGLLGDGIEDGTKRPNIFLACYFYPELFSKNEWEIIFDRKIDALWLPWGGFATIDKKDPRFTAEHTGMDNKSYHKGDSWFFLNNLAALVMQRVNAKKYKKYINGILAASTDEILNKGIFGYHAELSSAKELEANGCLAQAWSSALYIELIEELY